MNNYYLGINEINERIESIDTRINFIVKWVEDEISTKTVEKIRQHDRKIKDLKTSIDKLNEKLELSLLIYDNFMKDSFDKTNELNQRLNTVESEKGIYANLKNEMQI